ncbi:MAG: hypothetical protein ACK5Z5_02250 [Neisseriaceae bacterium]
MFEELYPWHKENYKKLLLLHTRLPPAILLYGSLGIGIYNLASNFIAALLCENLKDSTYCGMCSSCIALKHNTHPDLFVLPEANNDDDESQFKNITVDMVRSAINFAYLSPHLAKHKIIIIENLNLLNLSSANALLKILEEPPSYVLFILMTSNLGTIIPTIRSRCQKMFITVPNYSNNLLSGNNSTSIKHYSVYDGDYSKFWLSYYNDMPLHTPQISDDELLLLMDTLISPSVDNIFACTNVFNGKKISFSFIIEFFYKWLTDICIFKNTHRLEIFSDYSEKISTLLTKIDIQRLYFLFDELNFLLKWVNHPLNYKLQIENFLFQYQSLFI